MAINSKEYIKEVLKITPEFLEDMPFMEPFINSQINAIADQVNTHCENNPLPSGYYYGPIEVNWGGEQMITVTVSRNVYKHWPHAT